MSGWTWAWAAAGWASAGVAHAGPLCDALLEDTPAVEQVRAAVEAGDDPNTVCVFYKEVALASTLGGALAAIFLPVISWPIVFSETTTKKRKALPLALGVARRDEEVVRVLVEGGARPYDDAVQQAVDADAWGVARVLIDGGATPTLSAVRPPLAGDSGRLARAVALGIRLDTVTSVSEPGRLLTEPAVAVAFLDAGLSVDLLLPEVVRRGRAEVLDVVLPRVDPSSSGAYEALSEAAGSGRWAAADKLVAAGVPWERPGADAVVVAVVESGSASGLARVLAAGASPEGRTAEGRPAGVVAVERGRMDLLEGLLAAGAGVDASGPDGATALAVAAAAGRLDLVRALLARGASVDAGSPPPVAAALAAGHTVTASALIAAGGTVDDDAVRRLVQNDRADALRWVLEADGRIDRRVGDQTLGELAVRLHADEVIDVLIEVEAPLGAAAVLAAHNGDAEGLVRLLDGGADPAALRAEPWGRVDDDIEQILVGRVGVVPAHDWIVDAARGGDIARVRHLLANGAPAASEALEHATGECEAALLAAGARPSAALIERLVWRGDRERLERLGAHGAALDPVWDDAGEDMVEWMLAHGADPTLGLRRVVDRRWSRLVPPALAAGADVRGGGWLRDAASLGEGTVSAFLEAGHPYDAVAVWHDVVGCRTDRLAASTWTEPVSWRDVRRTARRVGCKDEVRAAFLSK